MPDLHDVVIIGGGIVGLATARALCLRYPGRVVVLEAETRLQLTPEHAATELDKVRQQAEKQALSRRNVELEKRLVRYLREVG